MKNNFSQVSNNTWSRKWGGTTDAVDPYITGYFFTNWTYLPNDLMVSISNAGNNSELSGSRDIMDILAGTCTAVTIPGGTTNRAEFMGLGGIKWGAPTNTEYDNTVTFKFFEFSGLPLLDIFHGWTRMIRDYRTGVSQVLEGKYTKSNYAATCYYWTTQPDGLTLEYYACLTGLFPLKDPQELYGSDLSAYDKLEMDIDFNMDWLWHEDWVKQRCEGFKTGERQSSIQHIKNPPERKGS
jgi:hypothetical protein